MRNPTRLGLAALVSVTGFFVACGDDNTNPNTLPSGGNSTGGAGAPGASGSGTAGMAVGGGVAGTFSMAGTAGTEVGGGGTGGAAGGVAGGGTGGMAAGTAGTGGNPPVVVPTVFLIDNVRLRLKSAGDGAGGAGGAGTGGAPDVVGGAADVAGAPGAAGAPIGAAGAAGAGGAATVGPDLSFLYTFDANTMPLAANGGGFSPGPGGSGGPGIQNNTLLTFEPTMGHPGGAAKISVPFTVATQQADFGAAFTVPGQDLAGYELLADVNMTETGDVGACATAWMYVYGGNGYANDHSGEPASGQTSHLVKGHWTTVRLDLDGPYGFHSTATFKPQLVNLWGIQLNTWGCP